MNYIEYHRNQIRKAKEEGKPKKYIQKLQQDYDKLIELDMTDIRSPSPFEFLYWN